MIKNIVFDLGGVLFSNGSKKFQEILSQRYHISKELIKEGNEGHLGTLYREGKITKDEFWRRFKAELKIEASSESLSNEWISYYKIDLEMKDLILNVKKNYKVFYLSDSVSERVEKLNQKYDFLRMFDDGIFSFQVGVRKPNIEIYQKLLEKMKVSSGKIIFIDDKESCLETASKLGWHTILFTSVEKLKSDLNSLGVNF